MTKEVMIKEYSQDDIKKYICPNATDQEFFNFCQIVKARNLNPFLKEVHFVKYGNNAGQIIVGKDAIIKRAKQVDGYTGFKAGWFNEKGEKLDFPIGNISGAWCEVFWKDKESVFVSVLMNEYASGQSTWKSKPTTMIRKVAVVQAHREFAPEETSGMYEAEEMEKELEPVPDKSESIEEKLKPKEEKPVDNKNSYVYKLSKISELLENKKVIQHLLKSEQTTPKLLRTEDEEQAERVYSLIKNFKDAVVFEDPKIEPEQDYFGD